MNDFLVYINGYYHDLEWDAIQYIQLKKQTSQDFDLMLIDPYKDEDRKELLLKYYPKAIYFPYELPPQPRIMDFCCINHPFLFGYERCLRFQQNRIISNHLIEYVNNHPHINIGFNRIEPELEVYKDITKEKNTIEEFEPNNRIECISSVSGKPIAPNPERSYGDWCLLTEDFLAINGVDECFTVSSHAEDMDMNIRWDIAYRLGKVQGVIIIDNAVYRPAHGNFSDKGKKMQIMTKLCCQDKITLLNDEGVNDLYFVLLGRFTGKDYFECSKCGGIFSYLGKPHLISCEKRMQNDNEYYSTPNILDKYGRDLNDINDYLSTSGFTIEEKIEYINNSWRE